MKYYFDQLDPTKFQQLVNAILIHRFGENVRLTPLRGADGGRDGETAPDNPFFPFVVEVDEPSPEKGIFQPGRYMFQVKHHDTTSARLADIRSTVVSEFEKEIKTNVLSREDDERVNFFFLITNVPSSEKALENVDKKTRRILEEIDYLYADVWWNERVTALLDTMPNIWVSFPELFPGFVVPIVGNIVGQIDEPISQTVKLFLMQQYRRERSVKFRQVELEHDIARLFVDLDVNIENLSPQVKHHLVSGNLYGQQLAAESSTLEALERQILLLEKRHRFLAGRFGGDEISLLGILLSEQAPLNEQEFTGILLEGGPGQGKSTITQMVSQIHRQKLLNVNDPNLNKRWNKVVKPRLPLRVELREFADFVVQDELHSVEQYLARMISFESGGRDFNVNNIQSIVERTPIIMIFDGLDEIGNDDLRDIVLEKILECSSRFREEFLCDLRLIITTRPPAIIGHKDHLRGFVRLPIAPLDEGKVKEYTERWLDVQERDENETERIRNSFTRRLEEPHVKALSTNPMQLSILLQFIRMKGEAFPDNRAQLYRSYFETVIDRDVEKSPGILKYRSVVESLHKFLGYKIHAAIEAQSSDGTFSRDELLRMVRNWLAARGNDPKMADDLFRLGEERLGLIVITRGEGESAQYGFEIQPVREYFAAAFINEEIEGDVEPIFHQMLLRPFWKEVALFLAGLRRNNEKANLILHAKELDASEYGWQQNGRSTIMQLLQEGVFSQPPQAYQIALEFITELLNPQLIPTQLEPKGYVNVLPDLINRNVSNGNTMQKRIYQMLRLNQDSQDEYALQRLYRVSSEIMPMDSIVEVFSDHQGVDFDLVAKLQLVWPYLYGDSGFISNAPYFDGILPEPVWIQWWWYVIQRRPALQELSIPSDFHQMLAEEFAINPTIPLRSNNFSFGSSSNLALWQIVDLIRIFYAIDIYPAAFRSRECEEQIRLLERLPEADYSGLSNRTHYVISSMREIMISVLMNILSESGERLPPTRTLVEYAPLIEENIQFDGLDGWFALRCAQILLQHYARFAFPIHVRRRKGIDISEMLDFEGRDLASLVRAISSFYSDESDEFPGAFLGINVMPDYVVSKTGSFVDLVDLLVQDMNDELPREFEWISRVQLPTKFIYPLIETSQRPLADLLVWISEMHCQYVSSARPIHVSKMHQIKKLAEETNDARVLEGSLMVLSTSNFLNLLGVDLLLKMMAANINNPYSARLFSMDSHSSGQKVEDNQAAILEAAARRILENPNRFGLRIVTSAARHLAENYPANFPPLLQMEDFLKIRIEGYA